MNHRTKEDSKDIMLVVRSHDVLLDDDYSEWIHEIKDRYRKSQIKAAVKVNSEQLLFNWQLGRELVTKKAEEKWGIGIVEQINLELRETFSEAKGFSARNLWYMKQWYNFYALQETFTDTVRAIEEQLIANSERLQQPVAELFPSVFGIAPWGHHILLISKCQSRQ